MNVTPSRNSDAPERSEEEKLAYQLLRRAGAANRDDEATAHQLIQRAAAGGVRRRARRRGTLALVGVGAVAAATLLGANVISHVDSRRLAPASTATTPSDIQLPTLEPLPLDSPVLRENGGQTVQWREQARQAMALYPGAFILPDAPPPGTTIAFANTYEGEPVMDISFGQEGVLTCVQGAAECNKILDWPVVREGKINGQSFEILLKPNANSGQFVDLTTEQQTFWQETTMTNTPPSWLDDVQPTTSIPSSTAS